MALVAVAPSPKSQKELLPPVEVFMKLIAPAFRQTLVADGTKEATGPSRIFVQAFIVDVEPPLVMATETSPAPIAPQVTIIEAGFGPGTKVPPVTVQV